MTKEYLSIQEAAEISGKSIQTIRRAIKSKTLSHRRNKTPQGFNYLIERSSLYAVYRIGEPEKKVTHETKKEVHKTDGGDVRMEGEDFRALVRALEKMVQQHSDERQNFMRLVTTLQEKIYFLENQVNLLKAPAKKWYQIF
ncbi:MAG: helix-turn-helix domain-containing protein [Candidatus Gracilibacteria bacterium]